MNIYMHHHYKNHQLINLKHKIYNNQFNLKLNELFYIYDTLLIIIYDIIDYNISYTYSNILNSEATHYNDDA